MKKDYSEDQAVEQVQPISTQIKNRIKSSGANFNANDNISIFINEGELDLLQSEVAQKMQSVLDSLIIDTENDHNTQDTANRVAKMYIKELYNGRYAPAPKITEFPNAKNHDELCTLGPIDVKATCSHHMVPIIGHCWIGYIPGEKVIGLSKFNRLVTWIMGRPHIQEEAVEILADALEGLIKPKGLAVVIKANHMCMTLRGVHAPNNSSMITSVVRGALKDSSIARQEFFTTISAQGFN
jgi:GTP cyclohydrolase I